MEIYLWRDDMNDVRADEEIRLDVSNIYTSKDFQKYLQNNLQFPDFYGMNWDAFWDTITGLIELPETVVIEGWIDLVKNLPNDANMFRELLQRYNTEYPMCKCIIRYLD